MKFLSSSGLKRVILVSAFGIAVGMSAVVAQPAPTILPTDRIVFVGDSITGRGGNGGGQGWVGFFGAALKAVHPEADQVLVALGGSGQTVGSWAHIEQQSRVQDVTLDVKRFDVKTELDQPAGVLVIMLGMNDVLRPNLGDTTADLDRWMASYDGLIQSLRARCHPRVVGLATVTPCTEDRDSPKNRVIAELCDRIGALAKADGCIVLPTSQSAWDVIEAGRTYVPDFHINEDTVHPNLAGHLAIAMGMLDGLGEHAAAAYLRQGPLQAEFMRAAGTLPVLSYRVTANLPASSATGSDPDHHDLVIPYWWHAAAGASEVPSVTLSVPEGFTVTPARLQAAQGEFHVTGEFDHLVTPFTLTASAPSGTKTALIQVPAAWMAGATPTSLLGWTVRNPWTFDPAAGALPCDALLSNGQGFGDPGLSTGKSPITWARYTPADTHVGGKDPNSIDFGGVSFYSSFSEGYAARWIHSDKDRPVQLAMSTSEWGDTDHLQVWINGQSVYAGQFARAPKGQAPPTALLRAGWNSLVLKSAHMDWLWQVSVGLKGLNGDDLSDLRYATVRH